MFKGKQTEEAKKKISEANKGRKHTDAAKKKMSIAKTGKKRDEATKKKMSETRLKMNKEKRAMENPIPKPTFKIYLG